MTRDEKLLQILKAFAIMMAILGTASFIYFYSKLDNAVYQHIKYKIEHDSVSAEDRR